MPGMGSFNSSPKVLLAAIADYSTNATSAHLIYTSDYKNWSVACKIGGAGASRGIAYDSTKKNLYVLTTDSPVSRVFKRSAVNGFRSLNAYSLKGAFSTSAAGNRLFVDSGRIMYGANNTICYYSATEGDSWVSFNTWSSSATRQPAVVRYFPSVDRYINGMVTVTPMGVTNAGSAFNGGAWTGVTGSLADPGWGSTTGRVWHVEEGNSANFIAVGNITGAGKLSSSFDLCAWTNRTWVSALIPRHVAWNGSMWVAVGNGGVIGTSTDINGSTWTSRTSPIATNLCWVGWDTTKQIWIAVDLNFAVITSPDGIVWTNNSAVGTNFAMSQATIIQMVRVDYP